MPVFQVSTRSTNGATLTDAPVGEIEDLSSQSFDA